MKTLIIVTHPNIESSAINKRWILELSKYPDSYLVHDLHKAYPDENINVRAEQHLIEEYDRIVFQFPLYWFSCPPLLKKWLDNVLTYGWAYGSKSGYRVSGKKIALAISAGIDEREYGPQGKYKYTVAELTRPFQLTFEYIRADYKPLFAYYGLELDSSIDWIENSVDPYIDFINNL